MIPGIEIVLYADDLVILVAGENMTEMESKMNEALKALMSWTKQNEMEVSKEKTKYQIFSMSNTSGKPNLFLGNDSIEETESQVYLGFTLDRRLTMKPHAIKQGEKAEKRLKILKRLAGSTWGTNLHTLVTTYKSYVQPVLTFGEEVMICASDSVNKNLEVVQNKALRIITGAIKTTPIAAMEMVTGIKPLKFSRECAAMKLYERIKRVPNNLFRNYTCHPNRLQTKMSFIDKLQKIYQQYNLQFPNKVRRFITTKGSRQCHRKFNKRKAEIENKINSETTAYHKEISNGKVWENMSTSSVKSKERKIFVANFRQHTGHDILNKHLARFGLKSSPICDLCKKEEQTSKHLLECEALTDTMSVIRRLSKNDEETFSKIYWHVRNLQ